MDRVSTIMKIVAIQLILWGEEDWQAPEDNDLKEIIFIYLSSLLFW